MTTTATIRQELTRTITGVDFAGAKEKFSGKVRENFVFRNGRMAIVVTDRVSAFDFNLGTIPFKGQVLNRLSSWWFTKLDDIRIPHHFLSAPHPNISLVRHATPLPIEFVIRAYLTGTTTTSSWYAYQHHDRMISGQRMPAGMKKNEPFPEPISTPSTKPTAGHDANISRAEILKAGLVEEEVFDRAERYAFEMFSHGQRVARERGLELVDTKYEMGLTERGDLIVIDEVHTPDSSRYWISDTYSERIAAGKEPENLDKEFVRRMIVDAGYDVSSSDEPAAYLTDKVRVGAAERYIRLYEQMTGEPIDLVNTSESEIIDALSTIAA
jgi:phosphoribosylaminoimidazole-succinocarboxamide synthase